MVVGSLLLAPGIGAAAVGLALFAACHFALLHRHQSLTSDRGRDSSGVAWRGTLAALFGLVHGLGFAGAITEHGEPSLVALLGFNLGVEALQLGLVALAWPALMWFRKQNLQPQLVAVTSAAGVACGTFWCLTRAFG